MVMKVISRVVVMVLRAVNGQELIEVGHFHCVSVIVETIVEVVKEASDVVVVYELERLGI